MLSLAFYVGYPLTVWLPQVERQLNDKESWNLHTKVTSGYKIVTVTTLYYNYENVISLHLKSSFQSQNDMKHEVFDDMPVPCMYGCVPLKPV